MSGRLLPAVALLAAGCGLWPGTPGPPAKPGAKLPVGLIDARYDVIETALQENKGSVVLIDFWSLTCQPCVAGFPHLVELHQKYADRGLTVMSVNLDPIAAARDKVLDFLKARDATFPNFILTNPRADADSLFARFGNLNAIPHQVLFDKAGNKVWVNKDDPLSDAGLAKLIEKELVK